MKIFTYWNDVELPVLNKYCMYTWSKYNPDISIICINDSNIQDYVKKFPINYDKLIVQHKSDYIRTYMLYHHGGIWLDNTIILKGNIAEMFDLNIKDKLQLFKACNAYQIVKKKFLPIYQNFYFDNNSMCCLTPGNELLQYILSNFEWCIENLDPKYTNVLYFKKLYRRGNFNKYSHFIQRSFTYYLTYMNIISMLVTGTDKYNNSYIISNKHCNFLMYRNEKFHYENTFIHLKMDQSVRKHVMEFIENNKIIDNPDLNKWFDADYFSIT
jgi:hypothetical protein